MTAEIGMIFLIKEEAGHWQVAVEKMLKGSMALTF
jgi:hypothetical protein